MPTRRQKRINELLLEELSMLIAGRVDDPRLAGITITRVETTRDLSTAKVFVTRYGQEEWADDEGQGAGTGAGTGEGEAEMLAALAHAAPFLRSQLGNLGLRRIPQLVFARDTQFESGQRVMAILEALRHQQADASRQEEGNRSPGEAPGDTPAGEGQTPGSQEEESDPG